MKAYTDIEQSKVLAEILPLESADMCYGIDDGTLKYNNLPWLIPYYKYTIKKFYVPCWSLTALLNVLPSSTLDSSNDHHYRLHCMERFTKWHDNAVDAYYEMILKLREQMIEDFNKEE